jgi:hypothetical protein
MKNYLLLLAAICALTVASCSSDKNDALPSKAEMLIKSNWKITERTQVTTDSAGVSTTTTALEDCLKDDTYTFSSGNKFTLDQGAIKCDSLAPQISTGTWALTENDNKLTITSGNVNLTGDLVELTSSKVVLKTTLNVNSNVVVNTTTFSAQ